jgi:hypothetical protein
MGGQHPGRHRAREAAMGVADIVLGSPRALRCGSCGRVMRDAGVVVEWVLCSGCMGEALPFQWIVGGDEYEVALREYRWGLRSRAGDFVGARFNTFDDKIDGTLQVTISRGMRWRDAWLR